jgi:DNA (cytosine-5)-methyltransferase 1
MSEYYVPSMAEIEAIEPNGFNVVSTFSGCGGSCLGYRMAGFSILYANEFIPAAQETYRANHPNSVLDARDIREVKGADILSKIGLKEGEIDLLDGSPPCASFSTAGKREEGWGKVKLYSDTKQRTDDLFFEYVRLLRELRPKTFVAENVSGLIKGTAKGYFLEILKAMKESGYKVKAKVLDAKFLGVPQSRERLIFIGVRNDLGLEPVHPKPQAKVWTVREAIPWILKQGDNGGFGKGAMRDTNLYPSPTIGATPQTGNGNFSRAKVEVALLVEEANGHNSVNQRGHRYLDVTEKPFPTVQAQRPGRVAVVEAETDISRYAIGKEWDNLKPGESTYYGGRLPKPALDKPCPTVTQIGGSTGASSVTHPTEKRKFSIGELKRICAFPDDFILTGTYAQQWERLGRAVPPLMMKAIAETVRDEVLCQL